MSDQMSDQTKEQLKQNPLRDKLTPLTFSRLDIATTSERWSSWKKLHDHRLNKAAERAVSVCFSTSDVREWKRAFREALEAAHLQGRVDELTDRM